MSDLDPGAEEGRPEELVLANRYRISLPLGRGGMGEVYTGQDLKLDRPVAIKLLRSEFSLDPVVRARFELEARAAARLSHPNVVSVFDVGEEKGRPFIVMEQLPPGTLADRISNGSLESAEATSIALAMLAALSLAHSSGILHRDIKPANILFGLGGTPKLGDFGIATIFEADELSQDLTLPSQVLGTPSYLAPERAMGRPATAGSDLFSLGVVLYEMVTGVKPFLGNSPFEISMAASSELYIPPEQLAPSLTPEIVKCIRTALLADPERRFKSAEAMSRTLVSPMLDTTQKLTLLGSTALEETQIIGGTAPGSSRLDRLQPLGSPATDQPKPPAYRKSLPSGWTAVIAVGLVIFLSLLVLLYSHNYNVKTITTLTIAPTTVVTSSTTTTTATTTTATTTTSTTLPPHGPPGKGKKN